MATKLQHKDLPSFKDGYDSFPSSKSAIKDTEIPYGKNVYVTDVGSISKRGGSSPYSAEIESGKALTGGGVLHNSSYNTIIVSAGAYWYAVGSGTKVALTGATFTDSQRTNFNQAFDKLYGANDSNALAYTADGSTITTISANGNTGDWPTFFNQRLYMTNTTYRDRIYYSNPYSLTLTDPPTLTGFDDAHMFDTDLGASPKKNAGFIVLDPGAGVEITRLFKDSQAGSDYLYVYTKNHGVWRITPVSTANSDGSIAHTVSRIITDGGSPAGLSVLKVANDQWYYGGDNIYTVGEQATYQNVRRATKSGRVREEIRVIPGAYRDNVCAGIFEDKIWYAYTNETYNNRCFVYDIVLNAWSPPIEGINASFFMVFEEDDGTRLFLAGSSNPSNSYLYQLESGTNDDSSAVEATFETKSTDCDMPGIIKRIAFIDVFYGSLYGALSYEVFVDETSSVTGISQIGNSTDRAVGVGSLPMGTFMVGQELETDTTFASLIQNNSFRIYCNYTAGKTVSVRFTNNNTGEQFKINGLRIYFLPGSVHET